MLIFAHAIAVWREAIKMGRTARRIERQGFPDISQSD
jgi:hypothetical protein